MTHDTEPCDRGFPNHELREGTVEATVMDLARTYGAARRRLDGLNRDRILTSEDERLAECDAHAEANERLAAGQERDDRTMGFTGTTCASSGEDTVDQRFGHAHLRHQEVLVARKRLDAQYERAAWEVEETHRALLSAACDLAAVDEEDGSTEARVDSFDVLPGGGSNGALTFDGPVKALGDEGTSAA